MKSKTDFNSYEKIRDSRDYIMISQISSNTCVEHYHRQLEMILCHSHSMTIFLDQKSVTIKRGDIVIVNSFCMHKYSQKRKRCRVLCLPLKYTSHFQKLLTPNCQYAIIEKQKGHRSIQKAIIKLKNFNKVNSILQDSMIYNLLGHLHTQDISINVEKLKSNDDITLKIIEYITNNYANEITLDSLASHCNLSRNYLSSIFNSLFECNLNEYLNQVRLRAFLEKQTSNATEDILATAYSVGYKSPRTFYNAFKKQFKVPPLDYLSQITSSPNRNNHNN